MKTSKYFSAIFLFSFVFVFTLQAQDTILNRNVQVEREFRPLIHDAGKINSMPLVLEPNVVKSAADYSNFNLPLNVDYNIHTLPSAELVTEKPVISNKGYARFGIGNYLNTLADFAYPIINSSDMKLDFSINHLATFDSKQMHSMTKTQLSFDKIFKTFDFYAGIGGGHEYFKYYGNEFNGADSITNINKLDSKYGLSNYIEKNRVGISTIPVNTPATDPEANTFWRFNALAGVSSLPMSTDLRYQAEMKYHIFNSVSGITENVVRTQAGFSSPNDKNRLGLDFDLFNMMYSSSTIPDFNFWKTYTVLTVNPYYSIERPEFNVRLGLKTSLSFVHGKLMNPSPDIRAEWKAVPQYLSFYGGLTGNYEVNTLDKTFTENPYMFSDLRLNDTYTPVDFYAGLKLKPIYNLLLDAYIDSKQIDNQYFYVNKAYSLNTVYLPNPRSDSTIYSNRFNVVYSGASHTKMGIRANYNYKNMVNVEIKWAYNSWNVDNQQYAWNMPKYDAQLNTDVHINDNLTASVNMYYEGVRYAKLGELAIPMNDKVDINLGIAYSYNNWLTVFGKINNLINNQYQNYYGYDVQGTNMMIGAAFSF
jgi:hypothetical protein